MRDMRKIKNRHIFELDNRQMVLVFVGLIIICLFVFTAGVMVGSRSARNKIMTAEAKIDFREKIKAPSLLEGKNEKAKIEAEVPAPKTIEEILEPVAEEKEAQKEEKAESAQPAKEEKGEKPAPVKVAAIQKENQPALASEKAKEREWFVQVASFQKAEEAERRAKQLRDKKYKVVVVKAYLGKKGLWYRVHLGPFGTLDKAKAFSLDFEKKEKVKTFIPN